MTAGRNRTTKRPAYHEASIQYTVILKPVFNIGMEPLLPTACVIMSLRSVILFAR